jgi:hypothetical protein
MNQWPLPKGCRLRLDTKERGIVEMAMNETGATVETVPEDITVMQSWIVYPNGTVWPMLGVEADPDRSAEPK